MFLQFLTLIVNFISGGVMDFLPHPARHRSRSDGAPHHPLPCSHQHFQREYENKLVLELLSCCFKRSVKHLRACLNDMFLIDNHN